MSTPHSKDLQPQGTGSDLVADNVVADPIPDPGLPAHEHRLTDTDPKAARRAEIQVASLFGLAGLSVIAFCAAYLALPVGDQGEETLSRLTASNLALGLSLGIMLFAVGAGAIHWAKKLMPDVEIVAERHTMASSQETRDDVAQQFDLGAQESGFGRRTLIRRSLIGTALLLPIPAVLILGDLGPLPGDALSRTSWKKGTRLVTDATFRPILASSLEIGQLVNAMPETFEELPEHGPARLNERAKAPVIVIRMTPEEVKAPPGRENWGVDGILVYSKICTHVGCPISLYEQQSHNLLCPCHQSTFKLNEGGRVIFGPARRALPQLAIEVDSEGYLVAQGDFDEPVGPSFWERG